MDPVVLGVLACYPSFLAQGRLEPLGNRGGFSGARLWRLATPAGALCLRAAAPTELGQHLAWRHRLMTLARQSNLRFVPAVLPTVGEATFVEAQGGCWELLEWLPGRADYRECPSRVRLEEAARAVALLHRAWRGEQRQWGVCPAVLRRFEVARCWEAIHLDVVPAPFRALFERLQPLVHDEMRQVPEVLSAWHDRPCALQPCLRDVWHDHLLFEGERLTGLVDYAALGLDSVAADLARLLGSLVEDDQAAWQAALSAYREVAELSSDEEHLALLLDRTGVAASLANWLLWLAGRGPGQLPEHILLRIELLARRLRSTSSLLRG
jgi:homoserine kinase type II